MNEHQVLAFMDEMTKIAEPSWHREAMARFGISKSKSKNSTRYHWAKEKRSQLPGGLADKKGVSLKDFPAKKLDQGEKIEHEHTKSHHLARTIAMDHLVEDPSYYSKLKKIEKRSSPEEMAVLLLKEAAKIGPIGNIKRTLTTMVNRPGKGIIRGAKATVREFKKHPIIGSIGAAGLGMGAYDAARKEDPTGQGRSRFHRAARFAGETAGGLIGAPYGLLSGGIAGSFVGGQLGKAVGSAYDRMRRPVAPTPAMVQGPPQAMQSQRM